MYEAGLYVYWPDGDPDPASHPQFEPGDGVLLSTAVHAVPLDAGDAVGICDGMIPRSPILRALDEDTVRRLLTGAEQTERARRGLDANELRELEESEPNRHRDQPSLAKARAELPRILATLRWALDHGAWIALYGGVVPQPAWIAPDARDLLASDRDRFIDGSDVLRHAIELGPMLVPPSTGDGPLPTEHVRRVLGEALAERRIDGEAATSLREYVRAVLERLDRVMGSEGNLVAPGYFDRFYEDARWAYDEAQGLVRALRGEPLVAYRERARRLLEWLDRVASTDPIRVVAPAPRVEPAD